MDASCDLMSGLFFLHEYLEKNFDDGEESDKVEGNFNSTGFAHVSFALKIFRVDSLFLASLQSY